MLSGGSDDWGDARPGASIADDDDWNEVAAAPAAAAAAAAAAPLEHEAVSDDDWNEVAAAAAAAPPPPLDHDAVSDDAAPAELAAAPAQVLELRRQKLQDSIATTVANFFAAGAYQHTQPGSRGARWFEALGGSRHLGRCVDHVPRCSRTHESLGEGRAGHVSRHARASWRSRRASDAYGVHS